MASPITGHNLLTFPLRSKILENFDPRTLAHYARVSKQAYVDSHVSDLIDTQTQVGHITDKALRETAATLTENGGFYEALKTVSQIKDVQIKATALIELIYERQMAE